MHCLLCGESATSFILQKTHTFWRCGTCEFIAKDPSAHLGAVEERARYETHENGTDGHRQFLQPVADLAIRDFSPGARGLDWGSGPVPTLAPLLSAAGFSMENYDPFFAPIKPTGTFDFITCTEAVEHFCKPAVELRKMASHLRVGGRLYLMTELWPAQPENWYYWRDPTHVGFFSEQTFEFFEKLFGLRLFFLGGRLSVYERAQKLGGE